MRSRLYSRSSRNSNSYMKIDSSRSHEYSPAYDDDESSEDSLFQSDDDSLLRDDENDTATGTSVSEETLSMSDHAGCLNRRNDTRESMPKFDGDGHRPKIQDVQIEEANSQLGEIEELTVQTPYTLRTEHMQNEPSKCCTGILGTSNRMAAALFCCGVPQQTPKEVQLPDTSVTDLSLNRFDWANDFRSMPQQVESPGLHSLTKHAPANNADTHAMNESHQYPIFERQCSKSFVTPADEMQSRFIPQHQQTFPEPEKDTTQLMQQQPQVTNVEEIQPVFNGQQQPLYSFPFPQGAYPFSPDISYDRPLHQPMSYHCHVNNQNRQWRREQQYPPSMTALDPTSLGSLYTDENQVLSSNTYDHPIAMMEDSLPVHHVHTRTPDIVHMVQPSVDSSITRFSNKHRHHRQQQHQRQVLEQIPTPAPPNSRTSTFQHCCNEIFIPPGALGFKLTDQTNNSLSNQLQGPVVISVNKHYCNNKIRLGDRVVAVDGKDATNLKAKDLKKMLKKNKNKARKITVVSLVRI